MPHPNTESPPALRFSGPAAQLVRLDPSLGIPAAMPLLLSRLMDICWVEEEATDSANPGDGE